MDIQLQQPRIMENLMMFAMWGEVRIFKALLRRTMDMNKKCSNGDTVLITALTYRQDAIVEALLRYDIDLNIVCGGSTALNIAYDEDNMKMVELLKEKGALLARDVR
jgi:ankyrin repeat protein